MIIGKNFEFEAAHQLPNAEIYGKCSKLHGHSYKLVVEVSGEVGSDGWIINFADLKKLVNSQVIAKLDHSFLNDIIELPTAENILIFIADKLTTAIKQGSQNHKLYSLQLSETNNSFAKILF